MKGKSGYPGKHLADNHTESVFCAFVVVVSFPFRIGIRLYSVTAKFASIRMNRIEYWEAKSMHGKNEGRYENMKAYKEIRVSSTYKIQLFFILA